MSDYQFRMLCSLAWLNLLMTSDDIALVLIAFFFTSAYSLGAVFSLWRTPK